ncbi:X-ray radiation resistance-associated protein 1 [Cynoglossus semilaevis]|uniref:X-ray radiation resistance-associated protein 1 n=1 Tax=Cynoglossus semilaevis TaxID=244447 RepID=UPI000D630A4B|nr:X-ray radiation resistance-associated protein 1 [Cynoglossus semilaevis]
MGAEETLRRRGDCWTKWTRKKKKQKENQRDGSTDYSRSSHLHTLLNTQHCLFTCGPRGPFRRAAAELQHPPRSSVAAKPAGKCFFAQSENICDANAANLFANGLPNVMRVRGGTCVCVCVCVTGAAILMGPSKKTLLLGRESDDAALAAAALLDELSGHVGFVEVHAAVLTQGLAPVARVAGVAVKVTPALVVDDLRHLTLARLLPKHLTHVPRLSKVLAVNGQRSWQDSEGNGVCPSSLLLTQQRRVLFLPVMHCFLSVVFPRTQMKNRNNVRLFFSNTGQGLMVNCTPGDTMAAGHCRLDDGQQSSATNCFPARTLLGRRKDGGHWLVSYRKAEEQRHIRLLRRTKRSGRGKQADAAPHSRTLDRALLLRLHCVDEPSELSSVNVSEQQLNSVKPEELQAFDNVVCLDASVNFLSLGSLNSFVSLRDVNLSVNRIRTMTFDPTDFPRLQVLDLSYNSLTTDDITSVSRLPRLKVLHLTGNRLRRLPPDLTCSGDATQLSVKGGFPPFGCLEVLMLDDNKLSSGVFHRLRNLRRLKHLNLRRNHIHEVPYLRPPEIPNLTEVRAEEEKTALCESADVGDDHFIKRVFGWSRWIKHQETLRDDDTESSFPLPELQFLDLSENRIAEEEALLAAALFPRLCELDIHSNPLTTRRSGELTSQFPRLKFRNSRATAKRFFQILHNYANHRPIISVDRYYRTFFIFTFFNSQLREKIPQVSKRSMLEEKPGKKRGEIPEDERRKEETENVFVTQVHTAHVRSLQRHTDSQADHEITKVHVQAENFSEDELELQADEDGTAQNQEQNQYQQLMETEPESDDGPTIGIQTAVRMLEHTLKNLNVYRESKPRSDGVQMPYREKVKRVCFSFLLTAVITVKYDKYQQLPPLKPRKRPRDRVDELLHQIRGRSSVRAAPCNGSEDPEEQKEVLLLLKDMRTKYRTIHRNGLERAADAESAAPASSV